MKNKYSNKKKENPKVRVKPIKYFFYLCLLFIIGRALQIQAFPKAEQLQKIDNILKGEITVKEKRGTIFDRNGEVLAISVDAWDLAVRPQLVKDFKEFKKIASITGIPEKEVKETLLSDKGFAYLKRKASFEEVSNIKKLLKESDADPRLFEEIKTHKRVYPNKHLAGAVIGFTNMSNHSTGIEGKYDSFLKGDETKISIVSVGGGNWYKCPKNDINAKPGKDVYLTIDKKIQHITEQALKASIEKYGGKDGKAVVINPKTGEILAMAQYPFFNPNAYWNYSSYDRNNRNALDAFEPGSIMKVFLVAGAIDAEFCTPKSIFFCQNGSYKIGPVTIHDTKPYKWLPVTDIIKYSSNIGATRIAEVVGKKPFYKILRDFGFGEKTGIDLKVEAAGILRPAETWTQVDTSNIAFGQGISASTIQLASAVSVIANSGNLMTPSLVKKITDTNGEIILHNSTSVKRKILSDKTAETIKRMMEQVVSEGTGKRANSESYTSGGKTGTSQKLNKNGTYSRQKYISTFLGFAPADNPEIAVVIAINEPEKNYYGGVVAAPVFKEITTKTLHYMNIIPSDITVAMKGDDIHEN